MEQAEIDRLIEGQKRLVQAAKEAHYWLGAYGYRGGVGRKVRSSRIRTELRVALEMVGALDEGYPSSDGEKTPKGRKVSCG